MHTRNKHIDMMFYFLRDLTNEGIVKMMFCGTHNQVTDVLTKPLKLEAFQYLREQFGVYEVPLLH